jgi:hypothetical protein
MGNTPKDDISVEKLLQENIALKNQINLINSEYDILRAKLNALEGKQIVPTKSKKSKRKNDKLQKTTLINTEQESIVEISPSNDIDIDENVNQCYISIIEHIFESDMPNENVVDNTGYEENESDINNMSAYKEKESDVNNMPTQISQNNDENSYELGLNMNESNDLHELENVCLCGIIEHFAGQDPYFYIPVKVDPHPTAKLTTKITSPPPDLRPRVIAVGTSLIRDLYLRQAGLNGCTYCYPGQYIPFIKSRLEHLLQVERPDTVFVQCGGNDLERFPNHLVIIEFEKLINTIKLHAPTVNIIIGGVPLRGSNSYFHNRISMFNTYLSNRAKRNDNVTFIMAAPSSLRFFKRDLIHFNVWGAKYYQENVVEKINYIHSFPLHQRLRLT